jgi:hypothetical protein
LALLVTRRYLVSDRAIDSLVTFDTRSRIVAAVPVVVSALALVVSFFGYRLTAVRGVKPVLVIVYRESGWQVKNIGNGPALDVIVAERPEGGTWAHPMRVPPLAKDAELDLVLDDPNVKWIGARYSDIDGRVYSSECSEDLTRVVEGDRFPHWPDQQILRDWTEREAHRVRATTR